MSSVYHFKIELNYFTDFVENPFQHNCDGTFFFLLNCDISSLLECYKVGNTQYN